MKTYPLRNAEGTLVAFEIPYSGFELGSLARLLETVAEVTDVRRQRWFQFSEEVHIFFRYQGREMMAWEPWGDSGRLWIGPRAENGEIVPLDSVEETFRRA